MLVSVKILSFALLQEHAPELLHNVALATTQSLQLSSFIEFSYPRPLQVQCVLNSLYLQLGDRALQYV